MRQTSIFLMVLIISVPAFSQKYELGISTVRGDTPEIYKSYYLHNSQADSSIFIADSISLFIKKNGSTDCVIKFYVNSDFTFFYNYKHDTLRKETDSGIVDIVVIEPQNQLSGRYNNLKSILSSGEKEDERLKLLFENGTALEYQVQVEKEKIILTME